MYTELSSRLSSENASLEAWLGSVPKSMENIDTYRERKLELLYRIYPLASSEQTDISLLPIWKLGAEIASDIVRTRVIHTTGDGFQITAPYPASSEMRSSCTKIYDTLINRISTVDRMYMSPSFEASCPDENRRLSAMRLYDMQNQESQARSQSANRNINRLFGSRG